MQTKIAVIGSAEFFERIQAVSNQVSNIELEGYIYQQPQEAEHLIKQIKPCDVVFLSGTLPYLFSKKHHDQLPIPVLYLAQDEMTIASTLLAALYHKNIALNRISMDLFDASIVSNVLDAVDIKTSPLHVRDYENILQQEPYNFDQLVSFHHLLWMQGEIDLAITSVHAVYDQLILQGVPAIRMADPKTALIRGLQDAKAKAEYVKSQASQVAVGYISVDLPNELQRKYLDAFAHEIYATVQQINDSQYILYSTRGDIESMKPDDLNGLFSKTLKSAVGFGYGATMKEAEKNAMIALGFAEKNESEHCCYILTEKKELQGPFPQMNKGQKLVNDHPDLYLIAQNAKLSPANLSKIIEFSKVSHHFTSADLADFLQVTRRTAERMIKKLSDHGYIQIAGEEMTYQQGRPRSLYKLNIPIYF
ncbi:HTH domain-containing protein [Bacillus sp. DTU_2020_1000418_1_SI_GHA_SEK_038]|uniref:HTH domain-containing protein n=1 Tax=Bacillus sp. DTU_2020_1000418_1_SI_GHA_SEK_038 TaxID=3077585 RepID=UPI0028EA2E6F|nr:HTH domain-containing protein [Bacillus sp. DTU_2020_1000418_1_SI_GHA_SEK_038]WNS76404.1 HTH domain-containing protein [Bacillus sp. DTU_2020_1000418_1_SI_GHA_SEK_038]